MLNLGGVSEPRITLERHRVSFRGSISEKCGCIFSIIPYETETMIRQSGGIGNKYRISASDATSRAVPIDVFSDWGHPGISPQIQKLNDALIKGTLILGDSDKRNCNAFTGKKKTKKNTHTKKRWKNSTCAQKTIVFGIGSQSF